ncbi:MAG: MotA/TolQ/ExbB proton channel family protein [Pseudomonadota bacterium]
MTPDLSASASLAPSLFDPEALAIVLAGTLLATVARAGLRDCLLAGRSALELIRRGFDEDANRTALARLAGVAKRKGLRAMDGPMPPDPALANAVDQLMRTASLDALRDNFEQAQAEQTTRAMRAAHVFEMAGEAAPIFGLVGTLFAMTEIAPMGGGGDASATTFAAIATAVISSLYGVLAAHMICLPVSGAITRRGERDGQARAALVAWLANEVSVRRRPLERVA